MKDKAAACAAPSYATALARFLALLFNNLRLAVRQTRHMNPVPFRKPRIVFVWDDTGYPHVLADGPAQVFTLERTDDEDNPLLTSGDFVFSRDRFRSVTGRFAYASVQVEDVHVDPKTVSTLATAIQIVSTPPRMKEPAPRVT